MTQLKKMLIENLIEQAGLAATNRNEAVKLQAENQNLLVADAHIETRDNIIINQKNQISEMARETGKLEKMLVELSEAAIPGMRKLRVNSPERKRLSLAIGEVGTIVIPF
jgi:hypothetical protein